MSRFAYAFFENTALVCALLILTKSVTTMLFIMATLKVVLTLTGGKYATTALSAIATVKSLGSVLLTNLAGQLAEHIDLHGMFVCFFWTALALLILSLCLRIPRSGESYFSGEKEA